MTEYYDKAGLTQYLEQLGFHTVGYGCTTCIGNSGPLPEAISDAVDEGDLVVCSVLSGNRNFEARIHPEVKANYLASPPLVVAYALAGRMDLDLLERAARRGPGRQRRLPARPLAERGRDPGDDHGVRARRDVPVHLRRRLHGRRAWRDLPVPEGELFEWEPDSTYVRRPPYFDDMPPTPQPFQDIAGARCLVQLGDSVTTDHISPAGSIRPDGPAGQYLVEHGVERKRLQLVRLAPRQPRGDGARHVRERAAAEPARPRLRGHLDGAPAGRRGDDDLRRVAALPRRRHADDRDRRQGVRLRLLTRLGGEGPEPARRPRRDRRELRADPPLEPADDGHPPAPVPATARHRRRSASPAARSSRSRGSRTARRRR